MLRGVIAIELMVFYFLLVLVVFYFLLGLTPVLWMARVFPMLALLRYAVLHFTKRERVAARRRGERLGRRSMMLIGLSLACIIILTIAADVYLFMRFGWLTALLYTVLSIIIASMFEASYEALEVSETALQ